MSAVSNLGSISREDTICPISQEETDHTWAVVHDTPEESKHHFSLEIRDHIETSLDNGIEVTCPMCRRKVKRVEYDREMSKLFHNALGLNYIPSKKKFTYIQKRNFTWDDDIATIYSVTRGSLIVISVISCLKVFATILIEPPGCREPMTITSIDDCDSSYQTGSRAAVFAITTFGLAILCRILKKIHLQER